MSSPSHSSSMPAFADVLSMIASIPDECHQRRVTHWAKEKYKVEGELEEKVERLEKTLANRDFKVKNLEQNVKLLQNVQVAYNTTKKDFSTSEKKVRILEGNIEAMEKLILEKNQAIKAILSESDDLQKQLEDSEKKNVFYEKEITKLLDEKEQLLEAAKEEESSDESSDDSDDDSDEDSSEDSDDDSESSDESEDSDADDDQTRFVAAATLLRRMESTIEKLEASEEKVKKLTEELESVKKEQQEMESTFTDRHTKLAELATDAQAKYEKCELSKKEMHLHWTRKLDAERLLKEKALKDVSSATRTIDYMKKIMHSENTKFQSLIDEAEKKQVSMTEELKVARDQKLALERKFKKLERAIIAEKDLVIFVQRNQLKELRESERNQCNERLASQDKLVAQMEKTFELQEEIKKLNDKIENLGVEDIESEDEEEEEVKEEKKQEEEAKEQEVEEKKEVDEEEYSSDSSFEPVDEADLYD